MYTRVPTSVELFDHNGAGGVGDVECGVLRWVGRGDDGH